MHIDTRDLKSAGLVGPDSKTLYRVAWAGGHATLKEGDTVVMAETPRLENVFIRIMDWTLHSPASDAGTYILVVPDSTIPKSTKCPH